MYIILNFFQSLVYSFFYLRDKFLCNHIINVFCDFIFLSTMNSVQVASIAKSADEVSSHVISGFFNMIKSELDQNIAAIAAKFKAVFELLTTKSATLEKQQIVMQDDYSRVSDRYNKVFQNLDEELEKRVVALDRNVFEISKRVQGEQLHSETSKKVTQFLLGVNEDEIVQQQLLIANAKSRVQKAIDSLAANVIQETVYSKKVDSIVSEHGCVASESNYIPVIFTEKFCPNFLLCLFFYFPPHHYT